MKSIIKNTISAAIVFIPIMLLMQVISVESWHYITKQQKPIKETIVVYKDKVVCPVIVTSYNATSKQCGPGKRYNTANGHIINNGDKILAVSRNLLQYTRLHYGDTVTVYTPNRTGRYVLQDVMNVRFNNACDVLLFDNNHFFEHGTITFIQ